MFGKNKRQIKDVTFVQPIKGEVYFYTPIAYSTNSQNPLGKVGKQVFKDSELALAGKLKLIFEREKMVWFEIKEEKSSASSDGHFFALYYYPQRLVENRSFEFDEKVTLQNIKEMFDFIVVENQTRLAEVQKIRPTSAYALATEELVEESDTVHVVAKEPEAVPEAKTSENTNQAPSDSTQA